MLIRLWPQGASFDNMNLIKDSRFYIYRKRSCGNCEKREYCRFVNNKDWTKPWLDCGKVGCMNYVGPFTKERKIKGVKDEK